MNSLFFSREAQQISFVFFIFKMLHFKYIYHIKLKRLPAKVYH